MGYKRYGLKASQMSSGRKRFKGLLLLPIFLALFLSPLFSPAADIPCAWTGVDRIVAVADLHGDYDKFVFILSSPTVRILDEELHWMAGRTHLVQLGDIMDRGNDAKKILDLLIRLEKEAAEVGGMVHTLLGNHEEMNITGIALDYPGYVTVPQFVDFLPDDFRKARMADFLNSLPPDQRKQAEENGSDLAAHPALVDFWRRLLLNNSDARAAYVRGFNDAYGDWLIKQNAVIKIDDVVFVHGGINEAFSKWPLREINTLMRTELGYFQGWMRSPQISQRPFKPKLVYNSDGPLWYRGLAEGKASAQKAIDKILANLGARAIVVGHTVRPNSGSSPVIDRKLVSMFQDKVWVMDTGISGSYGGIPSALIYDHGQFDIWGETEEVAARSTVKPPVPPPLPRKEMEQFLRTAPVAGRAPGPGGRTDAWRLTLDASEGVRSALFKYIDRRRPDPLPDSFRYELAAYSLDKYLDLGFVPPIVEYNFEDIPGALQIFVMNAISEASRKEKDIRPKDPEAFERAMADLRVFENLVYDDCRNEKDTLISQDDGKVYRVDFSEAFDPKKDTFGHCEIRRCSKLLYKKLLGWDDKVVADYLGRYLNEEEIQGLNARREIIIRIIQRMIGLMGEASVLF
jgi:Calcineurin-like phosphoesterase